MRRPSFYPLIFVFILLFSACDLLGLPGGSDDSYRLAVTRDGTGSGRVISSPAGIDCGADCSEAFGADTRVTLTATPEEDSTFAGWSESGCSGSSATCDVELTADKTVTATFDQETADSYQLTVEVVGSGTVTSDPAGIDCGEDCEETYASGASVTLTAVPGEGSKPVVWSESGCSGATCSVEMTADRSVTATFASEGSPTITSFGADKTEITAGESVELSWSAEGAKSFVLQPLGNVNGTSFTVMPTKTTSYILEATNDAGTTISDPLEITVTPSPTLPQITSFTADPGEIDAGDSTTLSWTVGGDGPVTVAIDNGVGEFEGSGSTTVSPDGNITYTLSASNDAGEVKDSVTVTVKAEPPPPSDGKITLLIAGQSNASSRGLLDNVESPIPQVRMFGNDYEWKRAAEPTDSNQDQVDTVSRDNGIGLEFGAGHSFGVKLGKELYSATGQNVYLIQSAKAGSCVDDPCSFPVWDAGSLDRDTLFGNAVRRAKLSAEDDGEGGAVTGIVWYQGESDQNNPGFVGDTKAVMNGFRRELGDSLPIIYVQLARRMEDVKSNRNYQGVREKQRTMETEFGTSGNRLDNFYMVVAHDLPMIQPNHVATEGQKILGERIALAYREHVLGQNVDGTGPRLQGAPTLNENVVTITTNQQVNDHPTYENYFTVSVGGSEKTLENGGISEVERSGDRRGVSITLKDTPSGGADVNVRYMPPHNRPEGVECTEFCGPGRDDYNYGPIPPQLKNVVKNSAGLPLPAFGYIDVD